MYNFKNLDLKKDAYTQKSEVRALEIAITQKCNFNCPYCGAYKGEGDELSVEEIIKAIEKVKSLERVILSGGEVTLKFEDCIKMAKYCKTNKIEFQINTNGSLLNKQKINELVAAGMYTIHISLNHTTRESHSEYYKVPASVFDKIVENIVYCAEVVPTCVVESIFCEDFLDNIIDVNHFLSDLNVKKHEVQYGINKEIWENHIEQKKIETVLQQLLEQKNDEMSIYTSCFRVFPSNKKFYDKYTNKNVYFTSCIEGHHSFHLHSNGDLIVCDLGFPYKFGNIRKGLNLNNLNFTTPEIREFQNNHSCKKMCILN